ncbi:cytochrome P450 [Horticoccus sp. 23ND18S-11]|uniref:cytochrome P450 n=1 Tax=Horticoccus sp. 23ND18S-11 TaxID=3391832 RepID=UPI0039C91CA6
MSATAPRAPAPAGVPLVGHALAFRRDPIGFLQGAAHECGPVARLQAGPVIYHLVSEPALIAEVLQTRPANYVRDTRSSRSMKLVTGESLLSTSGEAWRRHRRLAQPIFHQRRLAALTDTTLAVCLETAARWEELSASGGTVDLVAEMSRLTFSIVGRCLFSADLGGRTAAVESAYSVLLDELFRRARAIATLPLWVPTPRHRRFHHALASIDAIVAELIQHRRAAATEQDDLVGSLLRARDEDGSALDDTEIRNHAITFLLAGHETTASTLTWAFCLLDQHPGELAIVQQELARELGPRLPHLDTLPQLGALDRALQETLRLFPAIWIAERRVVATDVLGGFALPKNSSVLLSARITQRLASYWPEPDGFRPARFSGDTPPGLARGFFPFGAGPHHCIGQHFALLEARVALAVLLQRFRVRLAEGFPSALAGITLRPAAAVPVRIERRSGN